MQNTYSLNDLASDLQTSPTRLRKLIYTHQIKPKYVDEKPGSGRGGKQYYINPAGLPKKLRLQWERIQKTEDPQTQRREMDLEVYAELPKYAKEFVDRWITIIRDMAPMTTQERKIYIKNRKKEHPEEKLTLSNFYKNKKKYEAGGIMALAPGWGSAKKETSVSDYDYHLFEACYLQDSRPSLQACYEAIQARAYKEGREMNEFPSVAAFRRRLKSEKSESAIYLARYGHHEWNKRYGYFIDRDKSDIPAGSCWVSDHRQVDLLIYDEATGQTYRPWVTAWIDMKSSKWLTWYVHREGGNSDHIFQTFKWGLEEFGVPSDIYIDNGKDYRSNDFAGGRKGFERHTTNIMAKLNITPHFAIPYNAQAKIIERRFKEWINKFEKFSNSYTGGNTVERPESLKGHIKAGRLLTKEQFDVLFPRFLEILNDTPSNGKELQGLTPNELYYQEAITMQKLRPDALSLLCMRVSEPKLIKRNGYYDNKLKQYYFAEWMWELEGSERVFIRRDPRAWQEAWVFAESDNRLLGKAYLQSRVSGLVKDDIEKQKLNEEIAIKTRKEKMVKAMIQTEARPDEQEIIELLAASAQVKKERRVLPKSLLDGYNKEAKPSQQMMNTDMDEHLRDYRQKEILKKAMGDAMDHLAPEPKAKQKPKIKLWED